MHAPVGIPSRKRVRQNPARKLTIEIIAELMVTALKDLNTLIDDSAGNTMSAEMSNEPISLMPITTVIEMSTAIIVL